MEHNSNLTMIAERLALKHHIKHYIYGMQFQSNNDI